MENKPEVQTNTPAYYPPSLLLMSVALPVCAAFYLRFFQGTWTWESDSVHALLEGVGAFAAILLALVIIGMQRSSILNPAYLCVAASLISMGLLDSFHAGIQAGQIFVWFHSLSTFFGGILFTFIVLPRSFLQKLTSKLVPFLVGGASIILAMVSVLNPELVPTMVVDNTFSATAQFLNLAGGFTFFLSAGIIYWSDKLTRVSQEKILLASHCLLFGTAGVLFKFSAMWDAVWWFWHVIRFSAYLVILWFFIDVYLRNMRLVKQNQTQSQLTASRLQTIFNNVVDGIITLDGRLSITSLNPAAEEIFLYRQKELINKNINYLIQEDAKMLLHDLVQNNDPNTQVKKVEATGIRKTGEHFTLELALRQTSIDEKLSYCGIIRDISEQKRINQIKDDFVSTVSHELRTPLTSIRGSLKLLDAGIVDQLPESLKSLISIASNNSERLLVLINDLLDIQKYESTNFSLNLTLVSLSNSIRQTIQENTGYANMHHIQLSLKESPLDYYVYADRDRLIQAISNLVSNAVKFSPKGSSVEIYLTECNGKSRVCVTDQGPGISQKYRSLIFEKFAQVDTSTTRKKGGTGLGLWITKLIVEKHNGEIGVDSSSEKGTTFYIELPFIQDLQAEPRPKQSSTNNEIA